MPETSETSEVPETSEMRIHVREADVGGGFVASSPDHPNVRGMAPTMEGAAGALIDALTDPEYPD